MQWATPQVGVAARLTFSWQAPLDPLSGMTVDLPIVDEIAKSWIQSKVALSPMDAKPYLEMLQQFCRDWIGQNGDSRMRLARIDLETWLGEQKWSLEKNVDSQDFSEFSYAESGEIELVQSQGEGFGQKAVSLYRISGLEPGQPRAQRGFLSGSDPLLNQIKNEIELRHFFASRFGEFSWLEIEDLTTQNVTRYRGSLA